MEITDIRREKVLEPREVGELEYSIADPAAEVLGYSAKESKSSYAVQVQLPRLKAALAKLDIEILNRRDVERYKLEKLHAAQLERLAEESERSPFMYWNDRAINEYRKPVPDFVLNKAIQIKRKIPECEILVEELDTAPDPFLVVKLGYQETYYVEVWDEPGFEGRR